ncbi:hypothetical protein BDR26DRAFT_948153 [Obelidium mucronatum]|nr:hypothetical protein BDR26DRAFT_942616 [Obelidium mucronatum]KAI9348088.1 hypothetical protein BDR26DRAFT_948153 [Obelidium mucronatum]
MTFGGSSSQSNQGPLGRSLQFRTQQQLPSEQQYPSLQQYTSLQQFPQLPHFQDENLVPILRTIQAAIDDQGAKLTNLQGCVESNATTMTQMQQNLHRVATQAATVDTVPMGMQASIKTYVHRVLYSKTIKKYPAEMPKNAIKRYLLGQHADLINGYTPEQEFIYNAKATKLYENVRDRFVKTIKGTYNKKRNGNLKLPAYTRSIYGSECSVDDELLKRAAVLRHVRQNLHPGDSFMEKLSQKFADLEALTEASRITELNTIKANDEANPLFQDDMAVRDNSGEDFDPGSF